LLDSEILADVYLAMTGGQVSLSLNGSSAKLSDKSISSAKILDSNRLPLKIKKASSEELALHEERLKAIDKASDGNCVWTRH